MKRMLPDIILQSDLLDILFENRNKTYGAYILRKGYSKRLINAIAIVAGFVLVLSLLEQFRIKPPINNSLPVSFKDSIKLVNVYIKHDEPKERAKPLSKPLKRVVKNPYNVPVIVKTDIIDSIPTVEQIDKIEIGNQTIETGSRGGILGEGSASIGNDTGIKKIPDAPSIIANWAEIMPEFPGGIIAFMKFMRRNLRQPDNLEENDKFIVKAKFVVGKDGAVYGIEIVQSGRNDLDAEVLRVLNLMPKWKPGMQNGKNIAVYLELPVTFVGSE